MDRTASGSRIKRLSGLPEGVGAVGLVLRAPEHRTLMDTAGHVMKIAVGHDQTPSSAGDEHGQARTTAVTGEQTQTPSHLSMYRQDRRGGPRTVPAQVGNARKLKGS
jgi:hypothetical protein